MISGPRRCGSIFLAVILLMYFCSATDAADSPRSNLDLIQRQINKIKSDEAAERSRVHADEELIRQLEQQLKAITARDVDLVNNDQQLKLGDTQLKAQTEQQIQAVKAQLSQGEAPSEFGSEFGRYLGSHQFTWNGAVAGDFI
jgi:hypothetical protein